MTTGRVVVVKEYREPFVIEEYEVPDPEPGGLVLKITQAGICGSDLHTWRGDQVNVPLPESGRVMGHEGTGVVYQLGKGTTTDSNGVPLHEGDRIMYSAIKPCGNCYQCMRGEPNWCPSSPYSDAGDWPYFTGTYADYYWIRANHPVFKVPDELPDSVLGWVNCAMGTVTEGLLRAGAREGDYVVIQGAGGLGLNATAMAKDMGAHRVIVLDRLADRLELAEAFGADARALTLTRGGDQRRRGRSAPTTRSTSRSTTPRRRGSSASSSSPAAAAPTSRWSSSAGRSCSSRAWVTSPTAAPSSRSATSCAGAPWSSTPRRSCAARRSWAR